DEARARVQGCDDLGRSTRNQVRAPRRVPGDRGIRKEREVALSAWRRESASGSTRALRECFPGVTGVLDDVDDRRMIQVRMVSVAGDAERRTTDEGDVVRLRWVRRALPVLGDAVRVRELC